KNQNGCDAATRIWFVRGRIAKLPRKRHRRPPATQQSQRAKPKQILPCVAEAVYGMSAGVLPFSKPERPLSWVSFRVQRSRFPSVSAHHENYIENSTMESD